MNLVSQDKYSEHLVQLSNTWSKLLTKHNFDCALVVAGKADYYYDDDQNPPFHANPYILQWITYDDCEHCLLLVKPYEKPTLLWYTPKDFWYLPSSIPSWLQEHFTCEIYETLGELQKSCKEYIRRTDRTALIGIEPFSLDEHANVEKPDEVFIQQLAYTRAYKSDFEISQISRATEIAALGHRAAYDAFKHGESELDIHLAYLQASQQSHSQLPYPSIVGLNEHGSVLHYQHYDTTPPQTHRSLLIDAGAKSHCYHSDITRTYAHEEGSEFATLIERLDEMQQKVIGAIKNMSNFVELHEATHRSIADVLVDCGIVNCSADDAYEQKLTDVFYPHGTGHLLGLQTHDLGGHIVDNDGTLGSAPERFPTLRLIRKIEPNMVFTVEPGIYFIPVLLDKVTGNEAINWSCVEGLIKFGGVRIEDNVLVLPDSTHNFTRKVLN